MKPSSSDLVVLLPVFNDWAALKKLLVVLDQALHKEQLEAGILVLNDGSTSLTEELGQHFKALTRIEILHSRRNLGHQRAIAIGLAYIEAKVPCQAVVLMDSDGEDDPKDVPRLIETFRKEDGRKIVFAERARRSERWLFCFFYAIYRLLHFLLTGYKISIGNFSVIPRPELRKLVVVSETWNHYAAAVVKARLSFTTVPTRRAKRLDGSSQMNFVNLVIHGLSAISVYGDLVGVRLLMVASGLIVLATVLLAITVAVRLLTPLAIPGWATYTAGMLLVLLFQMILFAFIFSFIILADRQGLNFLPMRDYGFFVDRVETVYAR